MAQEKILIKFEPQGDKKLINAINALAKAQRNLKNKMGETSSAGKRYKKAQDKINNSSLVGIRNQRLLGNAFATLRSKLLLATFAMTLFIKPLIRMLEEAAKVKALTTAFDTLTGSTEGAVVSLNKLREATDNTMNSADLLQQANNALILGVAKSSDEMAEMFDIAQRLGRALGRDTASSVESLIPGIGRQSRLRLDNIGIIVKAEEAYDSYAKELGTSVDRLTDAQKKQAFFNATMESAREKVSRLGAETLTTQDIFNRAGASFDNLKVAIGDKLNPAIVGMTAKTGNAADSMATFIRELDFGTVNDMKNELADLGATMKEISMAEAIRRIPDMFENLGDIQKQIRDFTEGINVSKYEKFNNAVKINIDRHIQAFNAAKNLDDKNKALEATQKDLTDSQQASIVALMQLEKEKAGIISLTAREKGELTALVAREDERIGVLSDLISLFKQDISQQQALALANKLVSQGIKDTNIQMMSAITVTGDYNERIRKKIQLARDDMDLTLEGIYLEEESQAAFQRKVKASREDYELLQMRIKAEKRLQDVLKVNLDPPKLLDLSEAPITEALDVQLGLISESEQKITEFSRQAMEERFSLVESGQMTQIEARKHFNERMKAFIAQLTEEERKAAEDKKMNFSEGLQMMLSSINGVTSAQKNQLNAEMRNLKQSDRFKNASREKQEQLENSLRKKQAKERERIAKTERNAKAASALMNTYEAVSKAWAQTGIWGAISGGVALAAGLAQVQAILSTPIPKFAQGGLIGGRRHSQGGTLIEAEQGEFVMSRNAVQSVGLEAMNRINQGEGSTSNVTVNVSGNVLTQDFVEGELAENIKDAIRRGTDFGIG